MVSTFNCICEHVTFKGYRCKYKVLKYKIICIVTIINKLQVKRYICYAFLYGFGNSCFAFSIFSLLFWHPAVKHAIISRIFSQPVDYLVRQPLQNHI